MEENPCAVVGQTTCMASELRQKLREESFAELVEVLTIHQPVSVEVKVSVEHFVGGRCLDAQRVCFGQC